MRAILIVDYGDLTTAQYKALLHHVAICAKNNVFYPEPWPSCVPSPAFMDTLAADYTTAVSEAVGGDRTKITVRNTLRTTGDGKIILLGHYYELVANGNIQALESTGLRLRKTPVKPTVVEPPHAPTFVSVSRGPTSGTAIVRARSMPNASIFELQTTFADPTVDANWANTMQLTRCGRIQITGLTPLNTYHIRLRAFNKAGWGPWGNSSPITIL
jgi:hypothetical protein